MLDIKIINGKVIDAEERCLKEIEVGIKDGKIACLGKDLPEAVRVIDAKGHMISAGFIDIHIHEEDFSLTKKKSGLFSSTSVSFSSDHSSSIAPTKTFWHLFPKS